MTEEHVVKVVVFVFACVIILTGIGGIVNCYFHIKKLRAGLRDKKGGLNVRPKRQGCGSNG